MASRARPYYLVAVDGSPPSDKALAYALAMAKAQGVELRIVSVEDAGLAGAEAVVGSGMQTYLVGVNDVAQQTVDAAKEPARKAGVDFTAAVLPIAEPAGAIVKEAKACGATLIIVGSHGRTGLARALLGSVAEKVVRHAHCPVLVVR